MTSGTIVERIPGYCALYIFRGGSVAMVEDGRLVALDSDPSHPTGQAPEEVTAAIEAFVVSDYQLART
jgi:hypothetical protein